MVYEFLASKKSGQGELSLSCSPTNTEGSVYSASYKESKSNNIGKGYVVKNGCSADDDIRGYVDQQGSETCCSTPWSNTCNKNDESDCFQDFLVCDAGKVSLF